MLNYLSTKELVSKTIYISLIIQILTTTISFKGFTIPLKKEDEILQSVLGIETFVQFVEAFFYIWVILALEKKNELTQRRYIDWVITTPIMLISTIIYMDYKYHKETDNKILSFKQYLSDNKRNIVIIGVLNALMLLFGYFGETGCMDKTTSISIGFIFFFATFYFIYENHAKKTQSGKQLFYFMFSVWSFYGIAAMMDFNTKNTMYNMLDVVAKNFYGLFIYYKILQLRQ
mgnify:FL=1|tara:strand:- start:130 stop:822 length:693 start_codon:yes stop_codon:yes gene_type:complete